MRQTFIVMLLFTATIGCSEGRDRAATAPSPSPVTTPATESGQEPPVTDQTSEEPSAGPSALPGGELVSCNSDEGFTIDVPKSWHTSNAEGGEGCTQLHPEPFEPAVGTDERVAAITAYIDPVPFHEVAAPDSQRDAERAVTTIDGLQAVRLNWEVSEQSLWPAGTPITLYAVDLSPGTDDGTGTLFVDTVGLEPFDYERNTVILDRVARSIDVTLEQVEGDPNVVARYEGGGGGFTVEGSVDGDQTCLQIPPNGELVCTDVPQPEQVQTIPLEDLEPVLAGATGTKVHRITAERRGGEPATFLPAPIGDGDVRGFSFTFSLADVEQLTAYDIHGEQLQTINPGR